MPAKLMEQIGLTCKVPYEPNARKLGQRLQRSRVDDAVDQQQAQVQEQLLHTNSHYRMVKLVQAEAGTAEVCLAALVPCMPFPSCAADAVYGISAKRASGF